MQRLAPLLILVCDLLWVQQAGAATVALLRPSSETPAFKEALFRLQGELVSVGLSVVITDRPPSTGSDATVTDAWLEQTSVAREIDAFIDVVGSSAPSAADVWICERDPRRLRRERVVVAPDTANAAATLAIRAIEVLRSSFLALDFADSSAPPAPVAATTPAEAAPALPERAGRFGFEAGASALTSFDGVGPAFLPLASLDWAVSSWLALRATAAGFGTHPRVETTAGSVEVAQQFALLGFCACTASRSGLQPIAVLALGALHTALDGQASSPHLGHHVAQWSLLMDAGAGLRLNLPERYYLTLASHLQVATPYVAVHSVDTVVATTGRPNLLFALTAGVRL